MSAISIQIPESLVAQIDEEAGLSERSRAELLQITVEAYLQKNQRAR